MGYMTLNKADWLELDSSFYGSYVERCYDSVDRARFPPVKTKRDMVKRYQAGEFGNHSLSWNTLAEFTDYYLKWDSAEEAEASPEKFHLRNRVTAGETHYNLSAAQAFALWTLSGDQSQWYCSAMAPTHLLNGELMRTHEGLVLFYSTVQKPMRDSLREGSREAKGLTAKLILQHYMNQRSYDWTMLLLDRYPDHVIEFTVVDQCWGTVPGYNTLYWECRRDY